MWWACAVSPLAAPDWYEPGATVGSVIPASYRSIEDSSEEAGE